MKVKKALAKILSVPELGRVFTSGFHQKQAQHSSAQFCFFASALAWLLDFHFRIPVSVFGRHLTFNFWLSLLVLCFWVFCFWILVVWFSVFGYWLFGFFGFFLDFGFQFCL